MALGQGGGHVFVGQAVEAVAAQPAFPGRMRQGQQLLDLGQRVVEGGVEAGHLHQFGPLAQQDVHGLQRKGLVQWRQRDEGLEVGQHAGIDAHGLEVAAAAVHHAVGDGGHAGAVQLRQARGDALADQLQRGAVGVGCVQGDGKGRHAALAEVGRGPAYALDLAVPQRLARQRALGTVEDGELDAGRAAVEHHDQFAGGGGCGVGRDHGGEFR